MELNNILGILAVILLLLGLVYFSEDHNKGNI